MTFAKQLFRGLACGGLAVALLAGPSQAQENGENFHVLSNGFDVIYGGVGAGGAQVAGVDGLGYWINGEDLRGSTLTVLGDFGYKQWSMRQNMCVLGPPIVGLSLDFPAIVYVEMDGREPHAPDVFLTPGCDTTGNPVGLTSGGFIPYGAPPGSSANFLLSGLPSGAGLPSGVVVILPNHGLLPSSNGGTATLFAAASANLPIMSTGFCWAVQFTWAPTALIGLEDNDGWWTWLTNSNFGNQYWGISNDEMNVFQSQTIVLDGGATALIAFFASSDYETHMESVNPSTNDALAPAGFAGTGVYYATGATCTDSGMPGVVVNGGFDLGRHVGISLGGLNGAINPNTGLGAQDPAGSPLAPLTPSIGFVTWNNEDYDGDGVAGDEPTSRFRLTWVQTDLDPVFGAPADQPNVVKFFGQTRLGIQITATGGPFPQAFTTLLFTFFLHDANNQAGDPCWPDPMGFAGGTFTITPVVGSSVHLPYATTGSCAVVGSAIQLEWCSQGLGGASGPLVWDPGVNEMSFGRALSLMD